MSISLKSIIKEFIPPIGLRGCRWVKRSLGITPTPSTPIPDSISRNVELKGRHKNRDRCFIVGNGPSVKHQDLRPLRNEIVFVANYFNLHPQCTEISPRYWCIGDPNSFYPERAKDLRADYSAWFADITKKAPQTELLVPLFAKPAIDAKGWFSEHPIWYLDFCGSAPQLGYMDSNLAERIPQGWGTIDMVAIPAAMYMGFKEIYLLGCDCNMFIENLIKEDFQAEATHFYTQNPFRGESSLKDYSVEFWFHSIGNFFTVYRLLREYAEKNGVQIFNATKGGLLDVFPRCTYESLFDKTSE